MLISKSDFAAYVDISPNIRDEKLNPLIAEAERVDLMRLMGYEFFNYFIANSSTEQYLSLMNGQNYDRQINGIAVPVNYRGLRPVLVYFTTARLLRVGDIAITQAGNRTKNGNELSEQANSASVGRMIAHYENLALAAWEESKNFIRFMGKDSFPLFSDFNSCNGSITRSRSRIYGVGGADAY